MVVDKKELLTRLGLFSIIRPRMIPTIFSNIKMVCKNNTLTLTGNDGVNTIITSLPVESEDFSVLVPYTEFKKLIKSHRSGIDLEITQHAVFMRSGAVKNKLVLGQGGYIKDPVFVANHSVELKSSMVSQAVKRALSATSVIDTRPELGAVYFSDFIVGTDTRHIAMTEVSTGDFLLGASSGGLVVKNLKGNVKISYNEQYAVFETELCTIYCKLLNLKYPDYTKWLGDSIVATVDVSKDIFKEYIQNCLISSDERVELSVGSVLKLSSYGTMGESDLTIEDVEIDGECNIAVNPKQLLVGINGIDRKEKRVKFEVMQSSKYRMKSLVLFTGDYRFAMVELR